MNRNLDRRIETLVRVDSRSHQQRISELLDLYNSGDIRRWEMNESGQWHRVTEAKDGSDLMDIQESLLEVTRGRK
jgi:polyphosphate kinase